MNDTGIWTAAEINEKYLIAILNTYRAEILRLMERINDAALTANREVVWNIANEGEEKYCDIADFLRKKGFYVIIDTNKNLMRISW